MENYLVEGGRPLRGTVKISGAKNGTLPILAATVLCEEPCLLENCPEIADVETACDILRCLGGQVERRGTQLKIFTEHLTGWKIPLPMMRRMRASVLFLGALLARFGRAELSFPGGCRLGKRPIDLHLQALSELGVTIEEEGEILHCTASRLKGGRIELPFPSVGATENILMAAAGCRETTILHGAAREPEIADLAVFLTKLGAEITGIGTDTMTITGGNLHGTAHAMLPDRMESATFLCAAAATGGEVLLTHTEGRLLEPVLEVLSRAGCRITASPGQIYLSAPQRPTAVSFLTTAPYPGFPTDAQAPVMAALLRAEGISTITETIFEQRFGHVPQLRKLGAAITVDGQTAEIDGVPLLSGAAMEGGDLRGTAALVIGALQARGESQISGINHLQRGYDRFGEKLCALGAKLQLVEKTTGNFRKNIV